MNHSDQQSVERFVSTICEGNFADRLAKTFAANQVPIDAPELSVVLENCFILALSVKWHGTFGAAQRHYAMITSFVRLIRGCERLGATLIGANCIPSDEVLYQLRQTERQRRMETPH